MHPLLEKDRKVTGIVGMRYVPINQLDSLKQIGNITGRSLNETIAVILDLVTPLILDGLAYEIGIQGETLQEAILKSQENKDT